MKQMKPFTGKWRIVEMEVWDQDYVDMEVPGYIRIGSDGTGRFQFGLVSGDIDGRVEQCGNAPRFDFSWSGQEENDPVCGRGWTVVGRSCPVPPFDPEPPGRLTSLQETGPARSGTVQTLQHFHAKRRVP